MESNGFYLQVYAKKKQKLLMEEHTDEVYIPPYNSYIRSDIIW